MNSAKTIAATLTIVLASAGLSWAQSPPQGGPDAKTMAALDACLKEAGIEMPQPPQGQNNSGQPPAPPQDGAGQAPQLSAEQQSAVDACFAKAGLERPTGQPPRQ